MKNGGIRACPAGLKHIDPLLFTDLFAGPLTDMGPGGLANPQERLFPAAYLFCCGQLGDVPFKFFIENGKVFLYYIFMNNVNFINKVHRIF